VAIPLRVLIIEDRPDDAVLMVYALRQADFEPDWRRVDTEADYVAHLNGDLDVILADYNLPQFDALGALRLLQASGLDIPFIVVTGTLGEGYTGERPRDNIAGVMVAQVDAREGDQRG